MPQEIFGVEPGSDDFSHEIALTSKGRRYGLKLLNGVNSVHIIPPPRQAPPSKLEQNSVQNGRGAEVWIPNANQFYDSLNAWTSTPNKLHPAPLQRWYTGFRDAEMNMPDSGDTHKWVPLYAGSGSDPYRRYLSVSFTASATSNRERSFLIVRRRGTPGTLTVEWCKNSGGSPSAVDKTATKTISDAPDWVSYYLEFKPSSVWGVVSGSTYHIKIYGASSDNVNNCWEVLCSNADAGKNSSDNTNWSATTYSPYYRITDEDINQRMFMFQLKGAWYAVTSRADGGNSKLYIHGCRGRATAGATTTLTDSGSGQYTSGWTTNQWAGYKIRIVAGVGRGQVRTIASNTGTVITVTSAWDTTPTATSQYYIYGGAAWKEISTTGLGWVSGKPVTSQGTVYFPQDDSVDMRIMQLDYTDADDHAFDVEDTNHNRASFVVASQDASLGPTLVRANIESTGSGTPVGSACSIGIAPTAPSGTPVAFGTDVTFQTSIPIGGGAYIITGLYDQNNTIYVAKEDALFSVKGKVPTKIIYGADASPNPMNGVAACVGADSQFYLAAEHDVFLISGNSAVPLNLPFNLPSDRSGYVMDLMSEKGWMFAALDAGASGSSSIMRMTLQDRTWHEQIRAFSSGRRIRSVAWFGFVDTRPHVAYECQGELMYQEMPLYGVRPVKDTGMNYQHEGVIELPTIDLLNTDPKFFHYIELVTKGLASAANTAAAGREVALDYQLNNNIGKTGEGAWVRAGSFGISPSARIPLNLGSQYKIRPRLRICNNDPDDPPVVENFGLSLFTRHKQYSAIMIDVNGADDDNVSGEEIWSWLVSRIITADVVSVDSVFGFLHRKRMILPSEPNTNITNLDPESGFSSVFNLYMEFLPE